MTYLPTELEAQAYSDRINFVEQPRPEHFRYQQIRINDNSQAGELVAKRMSEAINQAQEKYGIGFDTEGDIAPVDTDALSRYTLLGPVDVSNGTSRALLSPLTGLLRRRGRRDNSISLASWFDPSNSPSDTDIRTFDRAHGCHTLFADEEVNGFKLVTARDLLDDIVCSTIRLKYQAIRDTSQEARYVYDRHDSYIESTVSRVTQIFAFYELYHTSRTDGAIVINHNAGTFVSQTRTAKSMLATKSFSLVTGFDMARNQIQFVGTKLPSSDAPELLRLAQLMEEAGFVKPPLMIHFHHPTFTRAASLADHQTDAELEYGSFHSGQRIFDELARQKTNWLILKNHGVLWLGDNPEEFEDFIKQLLVSGDF